MSKLMHFTVHEDKLEMKEYKNVDDLLITQSSLNWIHIKDLEDKELVAHLLSHFKVSESVSETILNSSSMPKFENYKDYIFLMLESIDISDEYDLSTQQLSILIFDNLIISLEEKSSNMIEEIILDIEDKKDFDEFSTEYVLFRLIDTIIEDSFMVLETIGERIDDIEDVLLINPEKEVLENIYTLKKTLVSLRKTLWLTRNAVNKFFRNNVSYFNATSTNYMHDIFDSVIQLIDLTENYRDICSGMLDIYLSSISNKTNDIMKVLTIYSTIFIPLTFIAGVYGMNFKYIPELGWKYSYLAFWIISIVITAMMLRFFRKKKWI